MLLEDASASSFALVHRPQGSKTQNSFSSIDGMGPKIIDQINIEQSFGIILGRVSDLTHPSWLAARTSYHGCVRKPKVELQSCCEYAA